MLNRPSKAAIVPVGLITALLAAMAVSLSLLLGGLVQAQETAGTFYHHENDTGPVVTLTATDPDKVTPIYWDILETDTGNQDLPGGNEGATADDIGPLDVADHASFKVEGGVLSFKAKPNYEAATPTDKTYKVVVQASDGGLATWVQYFKVTVIVLDVEEDGKVTWTVDPDGAGDEDAGQMLRQFQAGAQLTASVTDPDGPEEVTNLEWKWYRSSSKTAMGTIIDGETENTYTVSDATGNNDVGMHLRAVAAYTDRRGDNKTAEFVSPHPVESAKVEDNSVPVFAPSALGREVQEGPKGMTVGAPVTATDEDGDLLNYTLVAPVPTVTVGDADVTAFAIDQATGQITTAAALNYDGDDPAPTRSFTVTVRATDSAGGNTGEAGDGDPADATVTITLLDVNEAPDFAGEDRTADSMANLMGMAPDRGEEGVDVPWTAAVSTYMVTDPEGVQINAGKWSLSGDDAAKFKLTGTTADNRTLEFREKADFEMPGDKDKDNIYEVTVVASDGSEDAMRAVTVKITDSDEAGKITLSSENPVAGTPVEATLADSDGDVINVGWTWHALAEDDEELATTGDDANIIEDADSDTYTPEAGDIGKHLVAVASYMDRTEDEDNNAENNTGAGFIRFANRAESTATAAVIADPVNKAPEFLEGARAVRYVEENAERDETIGAPLLIRDADLPADSHTYTLSGTDATSFDIGPEPGQLMTKADLNYEKKRSYTVVVTVEDGSGERNDTDTITVTIQVKDLDEKPIIDGEVSIEHNENDTGPVVTLTATDPDKVTPIYWDILETDTGNQDLPGGNEGATADDIGPLDVADHASFKVEGGVLSFKAKPNYEAATPTDKTYKVVVQASDGGLATWVQYFKVTVIVLDVEEDGKVTWTVDPDGAGDEDAGQMLRQFQAGAQLTASVTDPDGPEEVTNLEWKWYRSSSKTAMGTIIDGETENTYTVSDATGNSDVGKHLRAVATYTDRRGENKTADFASLHRVQEAKVEDNAVPVFAPTAHTRRVQEGPKGMTVSAPVTATDEDGDLLNYTLVAPVPTVTVGDADVTAFAIDQATGQITTAAALNYDGDDPAPTRSFTVTVRATDSAGGNTGEAGDGDPADATVTITLLDVNEAPDFAGEDRTADSMANLMGMAPDRGEEGVDVPWTAAVSTYMVTDPEGVQINAGKWSLSGDDAAKFKLTGTTADNRTLEFREKADFEMPGDKDKDNIYEVTVVASDGSEDAMRAVTVKITDSDEAGKITLSSENPVAGTPVEATLADSDGDVINVGWTWHALAEDDEELATTGDDANIIEDADSDTYTPEAGDIGKHLVAVASYMDRTEDEDNNAENNTGAGFIRFANRAESTATAAVIADPVNKAPEFLEGARAVRYVEENAERDETIGAPLLIRDANGMSATSHTYTLSGTDAASFEVVPASGQLMTKAALDYETKDSYTVIVTVDDGSEASNDTDAITVTIEVKDLDEKPGIRSGGLTISGPSRPSLAEGSDDAVGSYRVAGAGSEAVTWRLTGTDARHFSITTSGGVVTIKNTPNYETKSSYTFTVNATVDGETPTPRDVTVSVTNVDEDGMVRISPSQPVVGSAVRATLTDEDGGVTSESWQWASADAADGTYTNIPGATSASYTPVSADAGKFLRATVRYRDAEGSGKSEMEETANAVEMLAGGPYDRDNSGTIDSTEVLRAVVDYFADRITSAQVLEVVRLYFSGS